MRKKNILRIVCCIILAGFTYLSLHIGLAQAQTEAPYGGTAWVIPGTVEAENYDTGGQNVGYSKPTAGTSGLSPAYRSDEVAQIEAAGGGGWDVGWTNTNDWYKYTVNVNTTGTYSLNVNVASPNTTSAYHVEVDGTNVTGSVTVPNTGGWQTYSTLTKTGVNLNAGQHVLRLNVDNGGMNFNWISFTLTSSGEAPYGGTAWSMPGTVEVENYDTGGQNVGYSKPTAGTSGLSPAYRSDESAQIESAGDTGGGFDVGWTNTNDWYKYTVNVTSTGTYSINVRAASPNTGSAYHVEVDGTNVTGSVTVPNSGNWQTYQTVTTSGVNLSAGQHVLRLNVDNGGMNFNWISISGGSGATATPTFVPNTATPTSGGVTGGAWQNGAFQVMVPNVVTQSNIITASANTGNLNMMPLGNGNLGAAVWADNGFTAQLNRAADTFPFRKSPGWVVISGLTGLGGGNLNIYDAMFTRSGGGMTATTYVLQNKDEMVVDVTGAPVNNTYTAQIQLWSGRSPAAVASGAFATLAETWVDNGSGGSNRTFGSLAGITAGGRNVTTQVINSTTVQVSFNPNTDGTFRVIVASPAWTGGNATTTVSNLIGSDASVATGTLRTNHLNWWHNFWANTGLIKITGTNGPYVENIRDMELYSMALSSGGPYPGNQAGVLDIVSPAQDAVTWAAADYWHWNLRMHVGAMLGAGHPELNAPYFNLYTSNLGAIQAWTQGNIGGDGTDICVPETMRFNGNGYQGNDIGNPSCKSPGPNWNAMDLSSASEVGLWIWQQYQYTKNLSFLQTNYPVMADAARYYLAIAAVGSDGKRHTFPSNAHETQWNVHDPTTDISAMKALFPCVIQAAQILNTDSALVSQLQSAIPQILDWARTDTATRSQLLNSSSDASGNDMIGMSYDPTAQIRNGENIGLEPVYPYNLIGLNSPSNLLALATRTYQHRPNVGGNDWTYDPIDAARLGDSANFQSNVLSDLQSHQTFIAGYAQFSSGDHTPYVEMDGVIAAAVQEALAQDFDGTLRIAPAWPMSSWDVDGTVFIQNNSKVHVQIHGGTITTAILEAGFTGNKAVVNPWGNQNINVIDAASGATVVGATTASQISIPVTSGHAYIIQLVSSPLSSHAFAQVNANPASSDKTLGSVKLGN